MINSYNYIIHITQYCLSTDDNNNIISFVNLSTRPDNVGIALITILEYGKTGETWIVEDNKPPRLVE